MEGQEQLFRRERRFLVAFLILTGVVVLYLVRPYLGWALLGLIGAHVAHPLHARLARALRGPGRAATALVAGMVFAVALPLIGLGYYIAGDVANLWSALDQQGLPHLMEGALGRVVPEEVAAGLSAALADEVRAFGVSLAPELVNQTLEAGIGIFVFGAALYGALVKREEIIAWIKNLLPMHPDREDRLLGEIGVAVDAVVYGLVVVAAVQAVAAGIVWWIAGLPSVVFWTVVMFVLSMVPVLGPFIVLLPAALWSYLNGDVFAAVVLVVGSTVFVGVIDNFLRPLVVGRKGGLQPTLVLLSTLGGLTVLGPIGVFAGPLAITIFLQVAHLATETRDAFGGDFSVTPKPPETPEDGGDAGEETVVEVRPED